MAVQAKGRTVVTVSCLVLLTVLAPLAVVATWVDDLVSDTDRYVATVAPLADDPTVQDAVAARVATAVTDRLQVRSLAEQAADALADRGLPERLADDLSALGDPVADSIEDYVREHVSSLVGSQEFRDAWAQANTEAHAQLVMVLTGDSAGAVTVEGDAVRLDLAVVVDAVRQRLVDDGFTLAERLPEVTAEFPLVETADLERAQRGFRLLDGVSTLLPWAALAALAGAVVAARDRRRTLVVAGSLLAASMVLLGVALDVLRTLYLDRLPSGTSAEAAAAVFDQVVLFCRQALRSALVVGVVVLAVAWVSGPGPSPSAVRSAGGRAWDVVRRGRDASGLFPGPVGRWVNAHRPVLRGLVLAGLALAYAVADHPTGRWTAGLVLVGVVLLAVVELSAGSGGSEPAEAS